MEISDGLDGYNRPKAIVDNNGKLRFTGIPVPLSEKTSPFQKVCSMPRSHFIDFIDKIIRLNNMI